MGSRCCSLLSNRLAQVLFSFLLRLLGLGDLLTSWGEVLWFSCVSAVLIVFAFFVIMYPKYPRILSICVSFLVVGSVGKGGRLV